MLGFYFSFDGFFSFYFSVCSIFIHKHPRIKVCFVPLFVQYRISLFWQSPMQQQYSRPAPLISRPSSIFIRLLSLVWRTWPRISSELFARWNGWIKVIAFIIRVIIIKGRVQFPFSFSSQSFPGCILIFNFFFLMECWCLMWATADNKHKIKRIVAHLKISTAGLLIGNSSQHVPLGYLPMLNLNLDILVF